MRWDEEKQETQTLFKCKRKEEKEESKRNGCHLGKVDHCGYAEQLQPTNISIKPAALSQSLTNGTLGRTEF